MRRWNPEYELQVECAELGGEEEGENANHIKPALQASCRLPVVFYPVVRTELVYNTLKFSLYCGRVPEAAPVVRLHLKVFASFHAQVNA